MSVTYDQAFFFLLLDFGLADFFLGNSTGVKSNLVKSMKNKKKNINKTILI